MEVKKISTRVAATPRSEMQGLKYGTISSKIATRIADRPRSAVFYLKRLFYRTMALENAIDTSKSHWNEFSKKLVEKMSELELPDEPTKIVLEYDEIFEGQKKTLKPKKATLEFYQKAKEIDISL